MNLAYTPINIYCPIPDQALLLEWFHTHKLLDTDYWEYTEDRHVWAKVVTSTEPNHWRRYDKVEWDNRRVPIDNPGIFFHPGFEKTFPDIANCIRQLPFKQLSIGGMLYQLGEIPLHQDTYDIHEPSEPRRYTIYLTNPDENTFYLSKDESSEKIYIKINKEYGCFVFNNSQMLHGASPKLGEKIILTMAGIIDNDKHVALIEQSLLKFENERLYL